MCVIRAIRLLAALSVATLLFYILLGHRQFHGEPRHPLGAMRPVFLLANLITFMTLVALCCIGSDKLKSIPDDAGSCDRDLRGQWSIPADFFRWPFPLLLPLKFTGSTTYTNDTRVSIT